MSTTRTSSTAPVKPVLKMTDEELRKSYLLFFPDGQLQENQEWQPPTSEFQKLSFLKDAPTHYSAHSLVES